MSTEERTIEERTDAVLEKIDGMKVTEERIVALEENDTMLMECILEMSEIVYA